MLLPSSHTLTATTKICLHFTWILPSLTHQSCHPFPQAMSHSSGPAAVLRIDSKFHGQAVQPFSLATHVIVSR